MDKDLKAFRVLETPEQEARRRAKGQVYPVFVCLHMHIIIVVKEVFRLITKKELT